MTAKTNKNTSQKNKTRVFSTYDEAMKELFPKIWKEEKKEKEQERGEEESTMEELAKSVLRHF